jgi:hypothetical protein
MGILRKLFGKERRQEKSSPRDEIRLWLRNKDDANDRELLAALLIKEHAPDWVAKKALIGDYRVIPDPQRGGCVVIFTR